MLELPMKNVCRVAPPELIELQIQSKGLLRVGFVKPVKAPYKLKSSYGKKIMDGCVSTTMS